MEIMFEEKFVDEAVEELFDAGVSIRYSGIVDLIQQSQFQLNESRNRERLQTIGLDLIESSLLPEKNLS